MRALPSFLILVFCGSSLAMPAADFERKFAPMASQLSASNSSIEDDLSAQARNSYTSGLPGGFKCPVLAPSATVPTNARFVRPSDIKVVGAIGDSITAANGAKATSVPGVLRQYRGLSWSVGGDNDISSVLTLPNLIKKYNTKLYGFSTGSGLMEDTKTAFYNLASPGDTAAELPGQSRSLVERITADKRQNDWKIITSFIGGNDVCTYCENKELYSTANFKKNLQTALDNFYNGLRNTIVNLVAPIDMTQVSTLPSGFGCSAVHRSICKCIYNTSDKDYATRMSRQYQQKIEEIIAEAPKRWPRIDFAVSHHTQFIDATMPYVNGKPDLSYFAPDCFHFSVKGHEAAAMSLWNNMMRPVNTRTKSMEWNRAMVCPTESSPYIFI